MSSFFFFLDYCSSSCAGGILLTFENQKKKDLTIDLRDAVGDRLHLSNSFVKDGASLSNLLLLAKADQSTDPF